MLIGKARKPTFGAERVMANFLTQHARSGQRISLPSDKDPIPTYVGIDPNPGHGKGGVTATVITLDLAERQRTERADWTAAADKTAIIALLTTAKQAVETDRWEWVLPIADYRSHLSRMANLLDQSEKANLINPLRAALSQIGTDVSNISAKVASDLSQARTDFSRLQRLAPGEAAVLLATHPQLELKAPSRPTLSEIMTPSYDLNKLLELRTTGNLDGVDTSDAKQVNTAKNQVRAVILDRAKNGTLSIGNLVSRMTNDVLAVEVRKGAAKGLKDVLFEAKKGAAEPELVAALSAYGLPKLISELEAAQAIASISTAATEAYIAVLVYNGIDLANKLAAAAADKQQALADAATAAAADKQQALAAAAPKIPPAPPLPSIADPAAWSLPQLCLVLKEGKVSEDGTPNVMAAAETELRSRFAADQDGLIYDLGLLLSNLASAEVKEGAVVAINILTTPPAATLPDLPKTMAEFDGTASTPCGLGSFCLAIQEKEIADGDAATSRPNTTLDDPTIKAAIEKRYLSKNGNPGKIKFSDLLALVGDANAAAEVREGAATAITTINNYVIALYREAETKRKSLSKALENLGVSVATGATPSVIAEAVKTKLETAPEVKAAMVTGFADLGASVTFDMNPTQIADAVRVKLEKDAQDKTVIVQAFTDLGVVVDASMTIEQIGAAATSANLFPGDEAAVGAKIQGILSDDATVITIKPGDEIKTSLQLLVVAIKFPTLAAKAVEAVGLLLSSMEVKS